MDFIDFMTWCVCWSIYLSYDSIPCLYTHGLIWLKQIKNIVSILWNSYELILDLSMMRIAQASNSIQPFPILSILIILFLFLTLSMCVWKKIVYNKSKYLLSQSVPLYCSRIESSVEWSSSYYHQHSIPYSSWESRIEITSLKDFVLFWFHQVKML